MTTSPRWLLLVGPKGTLSPAAEAVAAQLTAAGVRVAGFLQRQAGAPGEERIALERLGSGERVEAARAGSAARGQGEETHCSLVFSLESFAAARAWVEADAPGGEVVVVDCVGKLEAGGRGHHALVAALLRGPALPLLVVREEHLLAVMEAFALEVEPGAALTVPCTEGEQAAFVAAVRGLSAPAV